MTRRLSHGREPIVPSSLCYVCVIGAAVQGAESFLEEPEGYVLTGLWDGRIVRLLSERRLQHVASTGAFAPLCLHLFIVALNGKRRRGRIFASLVARRRSRMFSLLGCSLYSVFLLSPLCAPGCPVAFRHSAGVHHGSSCSLEKQKHESTRCARPLGLQFASSPKKGDKILNLVVCDAWRGLLHVPVPSRQQMEMGTPPTPPSSTRELLKGKDSAELHIANAITEETNGRFYVTDSSSRSDAGRVGTKSPSFSYYLLPVYTYIWIRLYAYSHICFVSTYARSFSVFL